MVPLLLQAEVDRKIFDIAEFKINLTQYLNTHDQSYIANCGEMFDKLLPDVPQELNRTGESIRNILRTISETGDVLYHQRAILSEVKKAVDDLVKQQSSAKKSFFGTKFTQGVKNLFTKKDDKKIVYNEAKKLFNDIFSLLSTAIDRIKNDAKNYKPLQSR